MPLKSIRFVLYTIIAILVSIQLVSCEGSSGAGDKNAGQKKPAENSQKDKDAGNNGSEDAGDTEDAGSSEGEDAGPDASGPPMPDPPRPCAEDPDADKHPNSDVNQVTGTVVPDFGEVPEGGEFKGKPEEAGPYGVFTQKVKVPILAGTLEAAGYKIQVTNGVLDGTVYAPSLDGGNTVADGPFPLIVVLPGHGVSYTSYATYSLHFASHGFAVLGVDTRSNLTTATHDKEAFEVVQCINWMEAGNNPVAGKLDMTKVAMAGHSKGGKVSFFAAALDPRIDIVIGWDPSNSGGPPCSIPVPMDCNLFPVAPNCQAQDPGVLHYMHAETLVLGEPRDSLVNPDRHHNSIHFYRGAPSPASLVFFDAGHVAPMSSDAVIAINKRVQMAMLLSRFKGMTGLESYLPDQPEGRDYLENFDIVIRVENK